MTSVKRADDILSLGNRIVDMVGESGSGTMCGRTRSWDFDEIRRDNLYEKVAGEMLPNSRTFWFNFVLIPSAWPVAIPLLIVLSFLGGVMEILGFHR